MKKDFFWTAIAFLVTLILVQTNPKHKAPYVESVAQELQSLCCTVSSTSVVDPCEKFWPITTPILKGVLYLYTKTPRNYLLFTWYTTYLPGYLVHGVGIGGQFWVWAQPSDVDDVCIALYTAKLPDVETQFTHWEQWFQ